MFSLLNKIQGLYEKDSCENLIRSSYDVSFSYKVNNNFQRNIDGKGIIQSLDKLIFSLCGIGSFKVDCSKTLYFFHSDFINFSGRKILIGSDEVISLHKLYDLIFDKDKNLKSDIIIQECKNAKFFLPYFECYVTSFKILNDKWKLEFEEI